MSLYESYEEAISELDTLITSARSSNTKISESAIDIAKATNLFIEFNKPLEDILTRDHDNHELLVGEIKKICSQIKSLDSSKEIIGKIKGVEKLISGSDSESGIIGELVDLKAKLLTLVVKINKGFQGGLKQKDLDANLVSIERALDSSFGLMFKKIENFESKVNASLEGIEKKVNTRLDGIEISLNSALDLINKKAEGIEGESKARFDGVHKFLWANVIITTLILILVFNI